MGESFDIGITMASVCYISPIMRILKGYGADCTEAQIFGLTSSWNFEYSYIHKNKQVSAFRDQSDSISVVGVKPLDYSVIGHQYGFRPIKHDSTSKQCDLQNICSLLLRKCAVIVHCDAFYLGYHPLYTKRHHLTNLLLQDCEHHSISFVDNYFPTHPVSTYNGTLTLSQLSEAIVLGENPFLSETLGYITVDVDDQFSPRTPQDALYQNAREMFENHNPYCGLLGIKQLATEMLSWPDLWRGDLQRVLVSVYEHIVGSAGLVISRRLMNEFLANECKFIELSKQQDFLNISRMWNSVAVKLFRCSVNFNERIYTQASGLINSIAVLESEFAHQIIEICG